MKKLMLTVTMASLLSTGCLSNPPTSNVHQPMSVRPPAYQMQAANHQTGAIFPSHTPIVGTYRPLFEDYRARNIGDTLTIILNESTTATTSGASNANRSGSLTAGIDSINKIPGSKALGGLNVSGNSNNTFSGGGNSSANNAFRGNITVTVIEVFPNGNLLVSGEKVITVNHGDEYIRFSGVVNPQQITSINTVSSTQVADARVEYKSKGYARDSQIMGWLSRFFLLFSPL